MSTLLTGRNSATTTNAQDFWLLCAADAGSKTLGDILHALYFLPKNYKLLVLTKNTQEQISLTTGTELFGRVRYETEAGLSDKTSPFFKAGAIIYGEGSTGSQHQLPSVIVATNTKSHAVDNGWNGFTIPSGNPEAMASAILRIARGHSH